jgi:PPM family protein phosphatase
MKLTIHAASDIGCVRTKNEDMILIGTQMFRDFEGDSGDSACGSFGETLGVFEFDSEISELPFLIAIADGMGGQKAGDFASEFVLKEMSLVIRSLPLDLHSSELKNTLNNNIRSIHTRLIETGLSDSSKKGMGSTFIGVLFYGNSVFMINIGDSRLYRFRGGILTQFSRDHSLCEMTKNPHARKNIIVNSFGVGGPIFFDFEDITPRLLAHDKLLLCSDGLTNELADEEVEALLTKPDSLTNIITQTKNHGGRDNISVIICEI